MDRSPFESNRTYFENAGIAQSKDQAERSKSQQLKRTCTDYSTTLGYHDIENGSHIWISTNSTQRKHLNDETTISHPKSTEHVRHVDVTRRRRSCLGPDLPRPPLSPPPRRPPWWPRRPRRPRNRWRHRRCWWTTLLATVHWKRPRRPRLKPKQPRWELFLKIYIFYVGDWV